MFRTDGSCRSGEEAGKIRFEDGYVAQLEYANTLIRNTVTNLFASGGEPPVIIIQAIPGTLSHRQHIMGRGDPARAANEGWDHERYLSPDGDYSGFSPEVTSVNTFRLIFDKLFGTGFGRLPDRVYANSDIYHLYDFFDITEKSRQAP